MKPLRQPHAEFGRRAQFPHFRVSPLNEVSSRCRASPLTLSLSHKGRGDSVRRPCVIANLRACPSAFAGVTIERKRDGNRNSVLILAPMGSVPALLSPRLRPAIDGAETAAQHCSIKIKKLGGVRWPAPIHPLAMSMPGST